jgi:hypothetical protein
LKSDMSDLQSSTSERCMGVALLQYFIVHRQSKCR